MSSGAWLEIDLLRQRRQRYGTERPAVVPVRTLLLRGALFGSALPLLLLLSCIWLWFSESRLRYQAAELQPLADEHDLLEVKIQKEKRALEDAVQINQALNRERAAKGALKLYRKLLKRRKRSKAVKAQLNMEERPEQLKGSASRGASPKLPLPLLSPPRAVPTQLRGYTP